MHRTVDDPAMAPLQPDPAAVRILLVDDKPQNLLALEALLGDLRLDLVRAESGAERERARLEEIFAQVPAAIAVLAGPDHVVTYVNPAGERIAGRRAAAMLGRPVREAFPELAGQGIFNPLDEVYRTGTPYVGTEVPARYDRDGDGVLEEAYFTVVYHAMRDADGVVTGVLQHAWEVTDQVLEHRRADELAGQMASERDRLRQVLDVLPEAVLVTDADGRVLSSNAAATEIMGLDMTDRPLAAADAEALDSYGVRHLDGTPMGVQSLPWQRSLVGAVVHGTQPLVRTSDRGRDVPHPLNGAPL